MKKSNIIITLMLSLMLIVSLAVPVLAEGTNRAANAPCPMCGAEMSRITTRAYQHDESFNCIHGKGTPHRDVYKVYEVVSSAICNSCSYSYQISSYEDHVFYQCR